jgi:hypothetical protein
VLAYDIKQLFGPRDMTGRRAHTGQAASDASASMDVQQGADVQRQEHHDPHGAGAHGARSGHEAAEAVDHEAEADDCEEPSSASVSLIAGKPAGAVQRKPPGATALAPLVQAKAARALSIQEAIVRYAPLVFLAPGETYRPADASDFIRNSRLRWSHDSGQPDDEIADKGHVSAKRLGKGGYSDQVENIVGQRHGPQIHSYQDCRPNDDKGDGGNEGFFLDLDNRWHKSAGTGTNMPVYHDAVAGHYITYWFFYKFNAGPASGGIDNHEGDWEHISVRLNASNRATEVAYSQHGGDKIYKWKDVPKHGTHTVVYSAKGSHASYATPGSHPTDFPSVDDTTGAGAQWKTWQHLKRVRAQHWYGYGGAWGEVGDRNPVTDTTGPQGPSRFKPPAPEGW